MHIYFYMCQVKKTCDLSKEVSNFLLEMEKIAQRLKPRIELYHGCTETNIDEFPSVNKNKKLHEAKIAQLFVKRGHSKNVLNMKVVLKCFEHTKY